MILKTTLAIFHDGPYQGEYDWKGGIPLSVGEELAFTKESTQESAVYVVTKKEVSFQDAGEDQPCQVIYHFQVK